MAAFFSEFKCEVTLAADADQAEDKLAVSTFDLVLTDLQMGYTSGLDVIRMVRHSTKSTVVFMMTGCKEIDSCRAAYEAGANKVFQKPLSMTMLQKNILIPVSSLRDKNVFDETKRKRQDILQTVKITFNTTILGW